MNKQRLGERGHNAGTVRFAVRRSHRTHWRIKGFPQIAPPAASCSMRLASFDRPETAVLIRGAAFCTNSLFGCARGVGHGSTGTMAGVSDRLASRPSVVESSKAKFHRSFGVTSITCRTVSQLCQLAQSRLCVCLVGEKLIKSVLIPATSTVLGRIRQQPERGHKFWGFDPSSNRVHGF